MNGEQLIDQLRRLERAGRIDLESDELVVRDPNISDEAMDAGSNGYHELDEVLVPGDGRIILLGMP